MLIKPEAFYIINLKSGNINHKYCLDANEFLIILSFLISQGIVW
jgi:hypothetical protein